MALAAPQISAQALHRTLLAAHFLGSWPLLASQEENAVPWGYLVQCSPMPTHGLSPPVTKCYAVQIFVSKTRLIPDNLTSLLQVRTEEPEPCLALALPSPPQPHAANRGQAQLCPSPHALSPWPGSCGKGWQHCWENTDCAGLDAGVGNYKRFVGWLWRWGFLVQIPVLIQFITMGIGKPRQFTFISRGWLR